MSLQNSVAQYTISITRDGNGAVQATQELQQLNATFERTAVASAHASAGFKELNNVSKSTKASLHELHTVGLLIGAEMAPQLTSGLMAVQGGMRAVSLLAKTTGVGLGTVTAAFTGLIATGAAAISMWHDLNKVMAIDFTGGPSSGSARAAIDARMKQLVEEGKLMKENAESMRALLFSSNDPGKMRENNLWVIQALNAVKGTEQQEAAINKLRDLQRTMLEESLDTISRERFAATSAYEERIRQIDELARAAGVRSNQSQVDTEKALAREALDYQLLEIAFKQAEEQKRIEKEHTLEHDKFVTQEMVGFERDLTIQSLQLSSDRVTQANREYNQRLEYYDQLTDRGEITESKLTQLQQDASIKRMEMLNKERDSIKIHVMTTNEIIGESAEMFASGFAHAFTQFASGAKSAGTAFREFTVSFLQGVAEMILKEQLLLVIQMLLKSFGFAVAGSGGQFGNNGIRYAAGGLEGISSVSSPTYFPKFNVVAGEAGREMLTVLARPRMMELGGVQSVVGQAGRNTLAISSASDLAARGGGVGTNGHVIIEIRHSEAAEARIVSSSIKGAVVQVTKETQQSGPLRKALKTVTK